VEHPRQKDPKSKAFALQSITSPHPKKRSIQLVRLFDHTQIGRNLFRLLYNF
jgi:hypothetical protein